MMSLLAVAWDDGGVGSTKIAPLTGLGMMRAGGRYKYSGARLCEPQHVLTPLGIRRLQHDLNLGNCCGSQSRAPLVPAPPRREICGPIPAPVGQIRILRWPAVQDGCEKANGVVGRVAPRAPPPSELPSWCLGSSDCLAQPGARRATRPTHGAPSCLDRSARMRPPPSPIHFLLPTRAPLPFSMRGIL